MSALHVVHSLAGGTGSGLGSSLTLSLRDAFSTSLAICSTIVAPFPRGEVCVADYNSLLSLAALGDGSDLLLSFDNEVASLQCQRLLGVARPTIKDLNSVIAGHVAMALRPAGEGSCLAEGSSRGLAELVRHLAPSAALKIAQSRMVPIMPSGSVEFTNDTWTGVGKKKGKGWGGGGGGGGGGRFL